MAPLGPFGPSPRLAVGVSGGPHSLALLLLAARWATARGGAATALVADHGLRPGSDAEAAGVAAMLRARGMPVLSLALGLPGGGALHERAREARLAALADAAGRLGAPWLLLGHHRADQAETLLFRLLRGSGEAGLAAMAPARPAGPVLLLRPLLGMPPARLETVVAEAGLVPLRDPSNDAPRFARARLRAALADPDGTGPGMAALAEAAAAFARRRGREEAAVAERLAGCAVFRPEGWVRLDPAALGRDAVARAALSRLLRAVSGARHPPPRAGVAHLLERGGGTLAGALWRGRVLGREPAACAPAVPARAEAVWDGRWRVPPALAAALPPGATIGALGEGRVGEPSGLPALVRRGLPALRVAERLRPWPQPGPEFAPLGGAVA
ncbi:tRNA lysidine(34) synthetase TilS [Roseomonas sp. OT10]|uniref:tRNA lysidine(34) synthetase TilS n=1 Tax=Roseomonas cutis TaxID=2897332 RepID=UPI001E4DAF66|nr:tRNA lysidine(34) synthetase TilS [Roseomonas sp. OT10]UFN47455.1 tRNA lysidine(34) synthetase TilS [Roseomonas sp. OT10]